MQRLLRSLALASLLSLLPAGAALAHRDGCHTWHACNWDADAPKNPDGSERYYVCGDLGYDDYCSPDPAQRLDPSQGIHTTLVDFQPPPFELSPEVAPPPPAPPFANPAGVLTPPQPPRPPIQIDCSQDRLSPEARAAMAAVENDARIQQGCLVPLTEPPLH